MQMSDKKENGIKLSWQHSSGIAGIPLKKRAFSYLGSWSPPSPSSQTTHATEFNEIKIEPPNSPTKEYKPTSDLCHQKSSTGNDGITVSFFKGKDEPLELSWQHSSGIAGIPLKKRPLSFLQSQSPPSPSSRTTHATEFNEIRIEPPNSPTKDYKPISDLSHQRSFKGKDELLGGMVPSFSHGSYSHNQGSIPTVDPSLGLELTTCMKPVLGDPIGSETATRNMELKPKITEKPEHSFLEATTEKIPSDKSAFHRVLGNTEALSLKESRSLHTDGDYNDRFKQEKIDPSDGDVSVNTMDVDVRCNIAEPESNGNHAQIFAEQSHSDVDTMMDTWGGFLTNEGKTQAGSGNHVAYTGNRDIAKVNHEACSSGMIDGEGKTAHLLPKQSENEKFKLSHSAMLPTMHLSSDSHINLHLNPVSETPSKITQAKTNADGCLPNLSLRVKPSSTTLNTVKSESYEMNVKTTEVESSNPKILSRTTVKSEPCTSVHELSGSVSSDVNSTSTLYVKSDPQDMDYQVRMKTMEERSQPNENPANYMNTPITGTDVKENIRQIDDGMASKSTVAISDISCDLQLKIHNTDISNGTEEHVECRYNVPDGVEFNTVCTGKDAGEIICQITRTALHNDEPLKTTVSLGDELVASTRTSEENIGTSVFNSESMGLCCEHTDSSALLMVTSETNGMGNLSMDGQINLSAESLKLRSQNNDELGHSCDADGRIPTNLRGKFHDSCDADGGTQTNLIGTLHDNDIEDGEVRDLQHCSSNNPSGEKETKHIFVKENPKVKQSDHFSECTRNQCSEEMGFHLTGDVKKSIVLTSETISEIPTNIITNSPSHHLSKTLLSKAYSENNSTLLEEQKGETIGQNIEASGSNMMPKMLSVASTSETLLNTVDTENGFRRGDTPYLKSAPENFSPGRPVYACRTTLSSYIDEESDGFSRRNDKYQGIRGGNHRDLRVYEKDRIRDGSSRKSDFSFSHEKERLGTFHDDRFRGPNFRSEQFSGSANLRYSRRRIVHETSFAADVDESTDSAGREARKSRRLSPRRREEPMLVGKQIIDRTMRGISPGPHSNYNRVGNSHIRRRGRRDISPDQGRGSPNISMRPRLRSPHLWSPRRLPDGFDVHPELIPCRTPQPLRFQRVGSSIEDGSFPENMAERRHGSPPFESRVRDGMRGICNTFREYDYPRQGRDIQRNVQRFQLIDPRVKVEEEYFDVAHSGQLNGMVSDDRMDDRRNFSSGRRGFVRSINCRYNGDGIGGDNDRSFSYRIERGRGPSRPFRFLPEAEEELPQRETLRGEHSVRNRMVDTPRRIRGMQEQEVTYDVDETRELHGSSTLKRRRF